MTIDFNLNDENKRIYAEEAAMGDVAELIWLALERSGLKQKDLAAKLGVRPAEVTHRLQGERNITVRTLAATLDALGVTLKVEGRVGRAADIEPIETRLVEEHEEKNHYTGSFKPAPTQHARVMDLKVAFVGG